MVEKEADDEVKYAAEGTDVRLPLPLMIAAWAAIISSCCLFFFAASSNNMHSDTSLWCLVAVPLGFGGVALRYRQDWAWWLLAIYGAGGMAVIVALLLFLWRTHDLAGSYVPTQYAFITLLSPLALLMLVCLLIYPPSKWPLSADEYEVHTEE
ncbi:MAG: hypothetical protein ACYDBB_18890 [Armatimonadota bacterium]